MATARGDVAAMRGAVAASRLPMEDLSWFKDADGGWFDLLALDPTPLRHHGLYVIWHAGTPGRTLYVGHGDLASELWARRLDVRLAEHARGRKMLVSWARCSPEAGAGYVSHLTAQLRPLIEERQTWWAEPVAVNAPFQGSSGGAG